MIQSFFYVQYITVLSTPTFISTTIYDPSIKTKTISRNGFTPWMTTLADDGPTWPRNRLARPGLDSVDHEAVHNVWTCPGRFPKEACNSQGRCGQLRIMSWMILLPGPIRPNMTDTIHKPLKTCHLSILTLPKQVLPSEVLPSKFADKFTMGVSAEARCRHS